MYYAPFAGALRAPVNGASSEYTYQAVPNHAKESDDRPSLHTAFVSLEDLNRAILGFTSVVDAE